MLLCREMLLSKSNYFCKSTYCIKPFLITHIYITRPFSSRKQGRMTRCRSFCFEGMYLLSFYCTHPWDFLIIIIESITLAVSKNLQNVFVFHKEICRSWPWLPTGEFLLESMNFLFQTWRRMCSSELIYVVGSLTNNSRFWAR